MLTEPLVEGDEHSKAVGDVVDCLVFALNNGVSKDRLTRLVCSVLEVYLVPVDPAEVVAELRQLETGIRFRAGADEDGGEYGGALANGVRKAARIVESILGLARCGEGCDGNCELTTSGPTNAEAELAELRAKTAEVIAELTARSEDAYAKQTAYDGGYHHAVSNAYESAADLVAEKLGVK